MPHGPGRDGTIDGAGVGVAGQRDDRDAPLGKDAARGLDAVELWQVEVDQNQIRRMLSGEGDRLGPVPRGGADREAVVLEDGRDVFFDRRDLVSVVFYDLEIGDPVAFELIEDRVSGARTS